MRRRGIVLCNRDGMDRSRQWIHLRPVRPYTAPIPSYPSNFIPHLCSIPSAPISLFNPSSLTYYRPVTHPSLSPSPQKHPKTRNFLRPSPAALPHLRQILLQANAARPLLRRGFTPGGRQGPLEEPRPPGKRGARSDALRSVRFKRGYLAITHPKQFKTSHKNFRSHLFIQENSSFDDSLLVVLKWSVQSTELSKHQTARVARLLDRSLSGKSCLGSGDHSACGASDRRFRPSATKKFLPTNGQLPGKGILNSTDITFLPLYATPKTMNLRFAHTTSLLILFVQNFPAWELLLFGHVGTQQPASTQGAHREASSAAPLAASRADARSEISSGFPLRRCSCPGGILEASGKKG